MKRSKKTENGNTVMTKDFHNKFIDFLLKKKMLAEHNRDKEIKEYHDQKIAEIYEAHIIVLESCGNRIHTNKESLLDFIKDNKYSIPKSITNTEKFKKHFEDYCDCFYEEVKNTSF